MTDIVLTGFMGTGKTSVGRLLARELDLAFVDTDEEIERETGGAIPDLFSLQGEEEFRRLERRVLQRVLAGSGTVVATGGGTLIASENRDLLQSRHRVFCLTAGLDTIRKRLGSGDGRPLASDSMTLERLLIERGPVYDTFESIETDGRSVGDVVSDIAGRITTAVLSLDVDWQRRTDIDIGRGTSVRLRELMSARGLEGQILLVTDRNVAAAGIARRTLNVLGGCARLVELPAGEDQKSTATLDVLYRAALDAKLDRDTVVIGLGGGVIGDLAGMLAATYLRGLRLVLVPTTLLAQVDASIGGKVGVDLATNKNLVGAFYPADLVVVDPTLLSSLPAAEIRNGVVEVIKIAAMQSADLFARLERVSTPADVARSESLTADAVRLKVEVVRQDPRESGLRAQLNFGHTIGHGVEAASNYRLSHGQSVAIGMVAESRLAERAGWADAGVTRRLENLLDRFSIPLTTSRLDVGRIREAVGHDKKRARGRTRIAFPRRIGEGMVCELSEEQVDAAIDLAIGEGR